MSDSFINKLNESTTVKATDVTAFDISDSSTGRYYTKKVTYKTISDTLKTDITNALGTRLDNLQQSLNTVSTTISNKLDKTGTNFNTNEKMSGPLYINSTLYVVGTSDFTNNINLHNNKITNLKCEDPADDFDAVNVKYLKSKIPVVPSTADFILKAGGTMTGSLTLKGDPTGTNEAATKKYVDDRDPSGKYLLLTGGTLSNALNLPLIAPTADTQAANKKYVDDQVKALPVVDTTAFLKKDGSVAMDTGKILKIGAGALPTDNLHVVSLEYANSKYLKLTGGALTGSLTLKGFSEKSNTGINGVGLVTLDLSLGNTFQINLNGNITGFVITNEPSDSYSITVFIKQTAAFTTTFIIGGTTIKWAGNTAPIITATAAKTDVLCFTKVGSDWYGFNGGQNF